MLKKIATMSIVVSMMLTILIIAGTDSAEAVPPAGFELPTVANGYTLTGEPSAITTTSDYVEFDGTDPTNFNAETTLSFTKTFSRDIKRFEIILANDDWFDSGADQYSIRVGLPKNISASAFDDLQPPLYNPPNPTVFDNIDTKPLVMWGRKSSGQAQGTSFYRSVYEYQTILDGSPVGHYNTSHNGWSFGTTDPDYEWGNPSALYQGIKPISPKFQPNGVEQFLTADMPSWNKIRIVFLYDTIGGLDVGQIEIFDHDNGDKLVSNTMYGQDRRTVYYWQSFASSAWRIHGVKVVLKTTPDISTPLTDFSFVDKLEIPLVIDCGDFPEPYTLEWDVTYTSDTNPNATWSQKSNENRFAITGIAGTFFEVNGDRTDSIEIGEQIDVFGNPDLDNDGIYEVTNVQFDGARTKIFVIEPIASLQTGGFIYQGTYHVSVAIHPFSYIFLNEGEIQTATIYENTTGAFGGDEIQIIVNLIDSDGRTVAQWDSREAEESVVAPQGVDFPMWVWYLLLIIIALLGLMVVVAIRAK